MLPDRCGIRDGVGWMLRARRASGDQAYPHSDQRDAGPALQADVLMQPEYGEQSHEDVADSSGGKDIREISEGKRGHVAGHESQQEENSEYHPGICKRRENMTEVMDIDGSDIFHAARQKRISDGAEDYDREQNHVFAKCQNVLPGRW